MLEDSRLEKKGRAKPSTHQLPLKSTDPASQISTSRGTFSARSTCQLSINLRERRSTNAALKSARASPAITLAPSTSLGLGLIGPRGCCTGTRTVYRYLNAARAESSSRRAPSIRSRNEFYLVSAKLTCSLKYPICGSSSSRGSSAPRCSAWITTAVGRPTSLSDWSATPRFLRSASSEATSRLRTATCGDSWRTASRLCSVSRMAGWFAA